MKLIVLKTQSFTRFEEARSYLERHRDRRVVIKAAGLAAGKGVLLPTTHEEAVQGLKEMMVDRVFGSAADQVVIEEYLEGEECSILAFTDGYTIVAMPPSQACFKFQYYTPYSHFAV